MPAPDSISASLCQWLKDFKGLWQHPSDGGYGPYLGFSERKQPLWLLQFFSLEGSLLPRPGKEVLVSSRCQHWGFCVFAVTATTHDHHLDVCKQEKCILSRFWRPEVQNQGVRRPALPVKALGEGPSWFLVAATILGTHWLVATSLQSPPLSLLVLLFCVSFCPNLPFLPLTRTPVTELRAQG